MTYMTIQESLRQNGDRHAHKAAEYLAAGRPDYAAGSMRKAERNWQRARAFEDLLSIGDVTAVVESQLERLLNGERRSDPRSFSGLF